MSAFICALEALTHVGKELYKGSDASCDSIVCKRVCKSCKCGALHFNLIVNKSYSYTFCIHTGQQ